MEKEKPKGYQGIFFDKETEEKLVKLQKNGLENIIKNMHITFYYGELEAFPEELMGKDFKIKLIGYASDGKNSGFQVEIPEELKEYYRGQKVPHITVSLGEVDGVKGKAVDTGNLEFNPLEEPIEVSGQLGYFEYGKGKTMDNSKFKEKSKLEEKGKKIYIVDHTWFSGDQGNNMNTDRIIHGIYTQKEDAIKMFEEVRLKDSNWYGGFQKAAILEGVLDGEYKENDITDLVLKELEAKKNGEKNTTEEVIEAEKNVIDIRKLGLSIGMEEKEQTLPNGKVVKTLVWDQENLLKAVNAVKHLSEEGKPVRITGPAPAWLVSALTHTVHPCPVGVYMPQIGKDVDIPKLAHGEINPEGEVGFKVVEKGDAVLIEYNMELPEGITTYDENNLSKVVVPEIPEGKEVYISGRGPNYLTVAIAEAYAHTNSSVSLFQPGIGYTCSITHSRAKKLGDLIKDPLGKEKVKEKLTVEKENKLTEQE